MGTNFHVHIFRESVLKIKYNVNRVIRASTYKMDVKLVMKMKLRLGLY